jgi:hypothetical protein
MSLAHAFANAVCSALQDQELSAAFDLIVARYFEEYTDATELDPTFYHALQTVFDLCFPSGEDDRGRDFEEIAKKS